MSFNIDFMSRRKIAMVLSALLLTGSVAALVVQGLNFGLDFTGGSLLEVGFEEVVEPEEIRLSLEQDGYENGIVQYFGTNTELLIRMPPQVGIDQSSLGDNIVASLRERYGEVDLRQSNFVGPAVGEELTEDGGLAMLAALAVVMIYILFRFTKQFSVGAVVALVHDVLIVLGFFAAFAWTFDLPVLAALLAVIGYSLNDTIVVSDRIRENFRKSRKNDSIGVINKSLNQTLGRTLVTSGTTLFVLLSLLILGGEMIRGFALALTIGVVVGTYSSIYVAATTLLAMNIKREDLLAPEREENADAVP